MLRFGAAAGVRALRLWLARGRSLDLQRDWSAARKHVRKGPSARLATLARFECRNVNREPASRVIG
jgi:hypothetical protein